MSREAARLLLLPMILGTLLHHSSALQAAPIRWEAAADTTDPSDVTTRGDLIEAVNAGSSMGVTTVNGVDFRGSDTLLP
ncbi:MAG: hypothetical protein GWO24_25025, partial [Akkermansiaceae bacterium]|nr:hypothetical protein [Akkermansiaceae bacterium]